jgi:hypothetical protein
VLRSCKAKPRNTCAQVDSGFNAHRAAAAWGCSVEAAEQAAVMAIYSVTICVADTPAAAASARAWAEALQRTLAVVKIVSAVSACGVTVEFFHSGVRQGTSTPYLQPPSPNILKAAVRREDEVVSLFQRSAAIMTSGSGGSARARFPGVTGLEHIKAGCPPDGIRYLPEIMSEPAALCAAFNRNFPSLTFIVTCGDENVRAYP